jgi:hypothetical protein
LGFTVAGRRFSIEAAKKILNVLQSLGPDRSVVPQKIFARERTWLADCDCSSPRVTGSSFGLGFETGYLLGAKKTREELPTIRPQSAR